MTASLKNVGATQLGKSGDVKLSELNTSDATTRVYGTGGGQYPYKRVNSNEAHVARSDAPAPSGANGTANSLAKWNGYLQWNASEEVGDEMSVATKECRTSGVSGAPSTACRVSFSFDRPVGYANFHQGSVQQQFYIKLCSDQNEADDCEDNPITGGSSYATGDGTSFDSGWSSNLQTGKWYIGTVRMQWDDTGGGSYTRDGAGYTAASGYSAPYTGIAFQMPTPPICNPRDCGLGSTRAAACLDFTVGGNHAYQTNYGTLSYDDTVYQSDCSTSLGSGTYIAFETAETTYSYSLSGGVIQDDAQVCGGNGNGE